MDGEREDLNTETPTAAGIEALLENQEEEGAVSLAPQDNPPGGEGADSGSAELVTIDPADEGEIENTSSAKDTPGIRTRPAR